MDFLKALLKALGASDEHIEKATAEKPAIKAEALANEILENTKEALKQDEEFMKPLRGEWQGELLSSKEREIVKLSGGKLTAAEINALPKENRFNKVLQLFAERLAVAPKEGDNKTADDKDKEIARLNGLVQERDTRIKTLEEVEIPAAKNAATEVETNYKKRGLVDGILTSAKDKKLVIGIDQTRTLALQAVEEEYDLRLKDGKFAVYEKGKDVLAYDPKDRSKPLSVDAVVLAAATRQKLFVENNGNDPPPGGGGKGKDEGGSAGGGKPKYTLPGQAKAEEHAKKLAETSAE